jgi:hypothetical protein
MNWLIDLYWNIRIKIEDKFYQWQIDRELGKIENEDAPFVGEYNDEVSPTWQDEEAEVKPKKKKAKKKSVKKAKKSV